MKLILCCIFVFAGLIFLNAQSLNPGDLAVIGVNADNDHFAVVALVDIPASTQIKITDIGWDNNNNNWGENSTSSGYEGRFTWTTPASILTMGTITEFTINSGASPSVNITSSRGSISGVTGWTLTSFALSIGFGEQGDQILIYQGSDASPSFIFGLHTRWVISEGTITAGEWDATTQTTIFPQVSHLPPALVGNFNISFSGTSGNYHYDNLVYQGAYADGTPAPDKAAMLVSIVNRSSWNTSDDTVYDLSPGGTSFPGGEFSLPVELVTFTAKAIGETVNLSWKTSTEINNYGFEVQRFAGLNPEKSKNWETAGFVKGNGNSNSVKEYFFTDNDLKEGSYTYRLKQVDNDGKFEYSNEIEVFLAAPVNFSLEQNFPNPFNPTTNIKYSVPAKSPVEIAVYDMLGSRIALLVSEIKDAGNYNISFNAEGLSSGVYYYSIKAGEFSSVKKMILLR